MRTIIAIISTVFGIGVYLFVNSATFEELIAGQFQFDGELVAEFENACADTMLTEDPSIPMPNAKNYCSCFANTFKQSYSGNPEGATLAELDKYIESPAGDKAVETCLGNLTENLAH